MNPHLLIFSQISKTFDIFIFLTNTSERSHSEEISLSSKKRFLGQQHFSNTVRDRVRVKFVCTWQKLAIGREIGKLKSKFCGVPQVPAGGIRKYENSIRSRPDYTPHRLKLLGYGLLWLGCAPPWETKSTLESIPSFFFSITPFPLDNETSVLHSFCTEIENSSSRLIFVPETVGKNLGRIFLPYRIFISREKKTYKIRITHIVSNQKRNFIKVCKFWEKFNQDGDCFL